MPTMKNTVLVKNCLKMLISKNDSKKQAIMHLTKNISSIQTSDLSDIVKFSTTIDDVDLTNKLFSLLGACISSNKFHHETLIYNNLIYEKMESTLLRCSPLKSIPILNLITAMAYNDQDVYTDSKRKHVTMHAKNMIRVSGCLRIITSLFSNSMMLPDTWKALCQCVAECCWDSHFNKEQCAHLISICIQKCLQGFSDAFNVLCSILNNHHKNIERFFYHKGILLFTRDNLYLSDCLRLLSTLMEQSKIAIPILEEQEIYSSITEILRQSGSDTKKGQWCIVILHHLNTKYPQFVTQENVYVEKNPIEKVNDDFSMIEHLNEPEKIAKEGDLNETKELLQNVVNEIMMWNAKDQKHCDFQMNFKSKFQTLFKNNKNTNQTDQQSRPTHDVFSVRDDKDISFSFLKDEINEFRNTKIKNNEIVLTADSLPVYNTIDKACQATFTEPTISEATSYNNRQNTECEFNPPITSTPKINKPTFIRTPEQITRTPSTFSRTPRYNEPKRNQLSLLTIRHERLKKKRLQQSQSKSNMQVSKLKNRSMSEKLIDTINDSCTTIAKSIKNIFMPWKSKQEKPKNTDNSFTSYMRKRDAILGDTRVNIEEEEMCNTCDNTFMLKEKVHNNDHLRETIKKIKLGINLYGCDFKKISKAFWPQEVYMTPAVLYNLYRKLILK